jgi:hypothetical protein
MEEEDADDAEGGTEGGRAAMRGEQRRRSERERASRAGGGRPRAVNVRSPR